MAPSLSDFVARSIADEDQRRKASGAQAAQAYDETRLAAERVAGRIVEEATRRSEEIVRSAEERRNSLEALARGLLGATRTLLEQLVEELDRWGEATPEGLSPREPRRGGAPLRSVADERRVAEDAKPGDAAAERESFSPRVNGPSKEVALEPPPAGSRLIEVEAAPVASPLAIADLERRLTRLAGVSAVRISRRERERVTFMVGVDGSELDLSALIDEGAQLEEAGRDRIALRLAG